jgi:hypothetical protein
MHGLFGVMLTGRPQPDNFNKIVMKTGWDRDSSLR